MPVFHLLGGLEVRGQGGVLVPLGRRKQRALLGMLLLRAGTVVRVDEIVDALWEASPPESVRANVHTYVSLLRRALDGVGPRPEKTVGGYRLDVAAGETDLDVFEALAADGRRALDEYRPRQAAERLARALGLWRGPLLEDLAEVAWFTPYVVRLGEARLRAVEDQVEARLTLGDHAELAGELAVLTAEHPLRERLWGQYLRALHRSGGRARALSAYDEMRDLLRAELAVEPGPELRELRREILDDGPAPTVVPERAAVVPAMLPAPVADFTGRREERRQLAKLMSPHAPPSGLTVAGITGMAGIGKTALAVHVAHAVADAYPDGQLYANLAGTSADVLGRFLRALGVPGPAVPVDPDERAELYRTMLSGRRVLVVLDNAAGERQVRPLLPGAPSCAVLLTSRARLSGLEAVRWTELTELPGDEGTRLLGRIAGEDRVAAEPAEAADVVRMCGGLPLAVRVAGARLTARPGWTLAHLAGLLRDERRRLDRLDVGDLQVRASLALSYEGLAAPARRLFRLLSLFDVPDFPEWLAEVLAVDATDVLDLLVDAHMLAEAGVDQAGQQRYRFHDLVRLFAREQAAARESPAARDDVLDQGLGAWLAVAEHFEPRLPGPCFAPIAGRAPRPDVRHALTGVEPLTWFDAEQVSLRAAIRQACATGRDEAAFDLVQHMEKYFDVRGMYAEWEADSRRALTACVTAGNLRGEAVIRRGLIDVTTWITNDHTTEAMTRSHHETVRLQELFRSAGEPAGMADAAAMRSMSLTAMGRPDEAVDAAADALAWAVEGAHLGGQARAHVAMAVALGESSRLEAAVGHLHQALDRARELGNPRWEATALQFLGMAHGRAGLFDSSHAFLAESLDISRRHGDAYTEVLSMLTLARLHLDRGDAQARPTAEAALETAREYRMTHHVADSLGILGEIALREGQRAEAVAYLRDSVAMWRSRGWLLFLARALTLLARALDGLDPDAAAAALGEAGELFTRAGDTAQAAEVARLRDDLHRTV
ncbi:AfsR/SARP family transcriptional regulator [Catenuloplanes japonicus]|uniref:AfsR/SARP family transcriptional regulator n=1 Tax=Catenuloplanes japonicus TaxID=33876 RepID=UPI00068AC387|nr:AfsR/SARP family transcriptional regulator [Catenuloplanes japonicus]